MSLYERIPEIAEMRQWDGSLLNAQEIRAWLFEKADVRYGPAYLTPYNLMQIITDAGAILDVGYGDWIAENSEGHIFVVRDEDFRNEWRPSSG